MSDPEADQLAVVVTGSSAALDIASHLAVWIRELELLPSVLLTHAALTFVNVGALRLLGAEVVEPGQPQFNPIEFANRARLFVVCPATANFVVSASLGLASSPALTAMLATPAQKVLFPHMNPVMRKAKTTQVAIQSLREDGCIMVSPEPAKVMTLWNRTFHDGEAMPSPLRTAEIIRTALQAG